MKWTGKFSSSRGVCVSFKSDKKFIKLDEKKNDYEKKYAWNIKMLLLFESNGGKRQKVGIFISNF